MIYDVTVKPNSKKGPLVLVEGNNLTVFLREKPIDGEANTALIKILAKHFRVAKSQVIIKSGTHGRKKIVEIIWTLILKNRPFLLKMCYHGSNKWGSNVIAADKGRHMKIKSIYIGGWFQRTTLQLSEIYDFLRDGTSGLGLDPEKLNALRENLKLDSIEYGVASEEFVSFTTDEQVKVKLFEDGLMIVSSDQVSEPTMFADVERLRGYYEERLSPAINYLFSLGAPVFKELSRVENIYPYFIVCDNASANDISELLAKTERQKYFEFEGKDYSVLRGDKYYFINNKKATHTNIERYIEEQVFIREFKGQLHRYLNLHRAIWGKIDTIKKQLSLNEREITQAATKLARYQKTALLVEGRLKQMSAYIDVRAAGVKDDQALIDFLAISGYRYPALSSTLDYVKSLWEVTVKYILATEGMIARAEQKRLVSSVNSLALPLGLIAVISVLGLLLGGTVLKLGIDTVIYIAILVIIGIIGIQIWRIRQREKRYQILINESEEN